MGVPEEEREKETESLLKEILAGISLNPEMLKGMQERQSKEKHSMTHYRQPVKRQRQNERLFFSFCSVLETWVECRVLWARQGSSSEINPRHQ